MKLLARLIEAGKQRELIQALDELDIESLFGSVLEKRFIERLYDRVEAEQGEWTKTIIQGEPSLRLRLGGGSRQWEIRRAGTSAAVNTRSGSTMARFPRTHFGSIGFSQGRFVGNRQDTIRTLCRICLARWLWLRSQRCTSWLRCHEALFQISRSVCLPSAAK